MKGRKLFYLWVMLVFLSLAMMYWGVSADSTFVILSGACLLWASSGAKVWWYWKAAGD